MKRLIFILSGIFIAVCLVSFSIKPAIIFLAKKQLSRVFLDSSVSIQHCNLRLLNLLSFSEIKIKRGQSYDIKIQEAAIQYSPLSIIKGNIDRFVLKGAEVSLNTGGKSILEFNKLLKLNSGKSPFSVNSLELVNLGLNIKSKELTLDSRISTEINLAKELINSLDLKIDSLEAEGLELKDAYLTAGQSLASGILKAGSIKYDKLKMEKIEGSTRLTERTLYFDSLSADLFSGEVEGNASIFLGAQLTYLANLKFTDLDLNRFVQDFKLEEKVDITGRMNGAIALKGSGAKFSVLDGGFTTNAPGGGLTIKDKNYLERIARGSGQSLDILVESFKNYRYNTGVMKLALEGNSLICALDLEGEAGKRNLAITVHDFKLGR